MEESVASTVTLSCSGNATRTVSVAANQLLTINTAWTISCSTVTVGSSNGWDTNFDDLTYDGMTVLHPSSSPTGSW
jgi:hypothetical protein